MNDLVVKNVNLFGDNVIAAQDREGNIWAGIRWFCNGLGLTRGQINNEMTKIQSDVVLKRGCTKFGAGVFDVNNETLALKLDYIPLWLAKIPITPSMQEKNSELVNKLVRYQLKAKDILAEAFLQSNATTTYQYPVSATVIEGATNAGRLFERIMKSEGIPPHEIARTVRAIFLQAGIDIPEYVVKIPSYEQLSLSLGYGEIVMR